MLVESTIESEMNYHFTNDLDFKESRLEKPPPVEYDERGNWVKRKIYYRGKLQYLVTREFEYRN